MRVCGRRDRDRDRVGEGEDEGSILVLSLDVFCAVSSLLPPLSVAQSHAISNVGWSPAIVDWYNANVDEGMVFANMDSLLGASIHTGAPCISNDYKSDKRKCGTPPGHPVVHNFISVPLYMGEDSLRRGRGGRRGGRG